MTGVNVQRESTAAGAEALAGNRATGQIDLALRSDGKRTRRFAVHESGSLRVRFPNASSDVLEAVLINTAGGMTGGDAFSIKIPDIEPDELETVGQAYAIVAKLAGVRQAM